MQASTSTVRATEILIAEHEVISSILDCLDKVAADASRTERIDVRAAKDVLDFLRVFADRCHHGKEEECLFPLLVRKGMPQDVGPVAVMLAEHQQGRAEIAEMHAALAAYERGGMNAVPSFVLHARAYVALLREHIAKENGVLFPMADSMLGVDGQTELHRAFEKIETHDMGEDTHERYLALARDLTRRLGVTPSAHPISHGSICCGHGMHAR